MTPSSARYSPYRTFIRVDLPAPFSPRRQWISPGSTTRSMWSLATRLPNRLVIPRSSSFMLQILVSGRARARGGTTNGEAGRPASPSALRVLAREVGLDGDRSVDDAGLRSCRARPAGRARPSTRSRGTAPAPTPSFSSVPTNGDGVEFARAGGRARPPGHRRRSPCGSRSASRSATVGSVSNTSASTPSSAISRPESRITEAALW